MRLLLTIVVPPPDTGTTGAGTHEVEVEAPPGTTAGELAAAVDALLHGAAGASPSLCASGRPVDDDAVVGVAPLVDGAALTLGATTGTASPATTVREHSPVAVAVAHGPQAGATIALGSGSHTIGRSPAAAVTVDDRGLSRLHACLRIGPDGADLADLGSTNGTNVDGRVLGRAPVPVTAGQRIRMGATTIVLRSRGGIPALTERRGDGTVAVNRRPRRAEQWAPSTITLPRPPSPPTRTRLPWLAALLPLPVAGVLALAFGPTMLAFALMTPVMVLGTSLGERAQQRRRYAAELAEHRELRECAELRVGEAAREEARRERALHPDPAEVLEIAQLPSARLWERGRADEDALAVSIGTCTRAGSTTIVRPEGDDGPSTTVLRDVPCVVPLATTGVLGIAGGRREVLAAVRAMLGQLVTLHSPVDLELVLLRAEPLEHVDEEWGWIARLPHLRTTDGHPRRGAIAVGATSGVPQAVQSLRALVDERSGRAGPGSVLWRGRRTVVVLDGADDLRDVPGLVDLLEHGPALGVVFIALAHEVAALPAESRAVLDLGSGGSAVLHVAGAGVDELVVDGVGQWWVERLSRALAPLRDTTPAEDGSALPTNVTLSRCLGATLTDPVAIQRSWASEPASTTAVVGVVSSRPHDPPMTIDLAADGPHLLVAGTTGSGKSELLRSLVTSLAVGNRPEHLSFVLVDYKGGAAFRECAALPHVCGLVTDLDEHLAERALTSLRAELTRRERVLAAAGVPDFSAYQRLPGDQAPLPRLVVVIDEFRALAEELPAFVDGIVRFAALGRSLGVHVVLATQRPAGVVTADIKANVNLRIALRMRDRSESVDVLDHPGAASISADVPGRALASRGEGTPVEFQTAVVAPSGSRRLAVRRARLGDHVEPWPAAATPADEAECETTELARVVAAVRTASEAVGATAPHPAWLPALPTQWRPPSTAPASVVGLCDRPHKQRQDLLCFNPRAGGHWGFVGSPGSGRTTALLTIASAVTAGHGVDDVHLYAVSGGSLASLESLPHCGAHVTWDDLPRLARLVDRLDEEVARRRRLLTTSGHPGMTQWWAADVTAPPPMVLLVDDLDQLVQRTDAHQHGALTERLLGLLGSGNGAGLVAVLAGDRSLLAGRAASSLATRVVLRLADPTLAVLAGLPSSALGRELPAGRGVLADGTEVQLALPSRRRAAHPQAARHQPVRVEPLPSVVHESDLPSSAGLETTVWVGVGGDDAVAQGLDPAVDGRRWLVCGSTGSGLTSTLLVLARQLSCAGHHVAVVASESAREWQGATVDVPGLECFTPSDVDSLTASREARRDLAVVVDDADELVDTPMESVLTEVAALVDRDGGLVVLGCDPATLSTRFRGLVCDFARHRTGIVLGTAGSGTNTVLGVALDRTPGPPGRGFVVRRGAATAVQVALPSALAVPPGR